LERDGGGGAELTPLAVVRFQNAAVGMYSIGALRIALASLNAPAESSDETAASHEGQHQFYIGEGVSDSGTQTQEWSDDTEAVHWDAQERFALARSHNDADISYMHPLPFPIDAPKAEEQGHAQLPACTARPPGQLPGGDSAEHLQAIVEHEGEGERGLDSHAELPAATARPPGSEFPFTPPYTGRSLFAPGTRAIDEGDDVYAFPDINALPLLPPLPCSPGSSRVSANDNAGASDPVSGMEWGPRDSSPRSSGASTTSIEFVADDTSLRRAKQAIIRSFNRGVTDIELLAVIGVECIEDDVSSEKELGYWHTKIKDEIVTLFAFATETADNQEAHLGERR